MKTNNTLMAFLAGITAGAVIGLVMVAGEKNSEPVNDGFPEDQVFGDLRDKYANMLRRLNDQLDAVKQEYEVMESRH